MDNMNQQMNNMPMGNSGQNKRMMYIVLAVVVVVVLAFWWWASRTTVAPQPGVEAPAELESINQELEDLDIGDINDEFEQIDQELDTL